MAIPKTRKPHSHKARGKNSRRVGKLNEKHAKNVLEAAGWYVSDTEIAGLEGDDIFAKDPDGVWWSVEVKARATWNKEYVAQAMNQAQARHAQIQAGMKDPVKAANYKILGIDKYSYRQWMVMFRPRDINFAGRMFICVHKRLKSNQTVATIMGDVHGNVTEL